MNKFFKLTGIRIGLVLSLFVGFAASAAQAPSHLPSKSQLKEMLNHNQSALQNFDANTLAATEGQVFKVPYAEYDEAGYLIFSAEEDFNSAHIKKSLIENLPVDMTAIIYTDANSDAEIERIYNKFVSYAQSPSQIRIAYIPRSYRGFWARDAVPVPVWKTDKSNPIAGPEFGVVDAKYYHSFEPDEFFSQAFQSSVTSYNFYFEGGNFVANSKGDCLIVNKVETQDIPDSIFLNHYGCSNIVRLDHIVGIGHADEVVKFVSDDHVITDQLSYKGLLASHGFKVTMIPEARNEFETYVNSLIIGKNVFVPIFGQSTDDLVLETYEDLGFNAIGLNSSTLSNRGAGSIHCITMTYPKDVTYDKIIDTIEGKDVTPHIVNVLRNNSRMPLDDFPGLETYEREPDSDYVGGFMEPDDNSSEEDYPEF